MEKHMTRYCNFCGFSEHERFMLVAGPGAVFICDECVPMIQEIITDERVKRACEQPKQSRSHHDD